MSDPALPDSVVVDQHGHYWRDFGEYLSMPPVSDENVETHATTTYVKASDVAYFLFQLGYPYDIQVIDSDGDPVVPPVPVLEALINEWLLFDVQPDTDAMRESYRDQFAVEIGRDPWEPMEVSA